jgi:hypothetical protein
MMSSAQSEVGLPVYSKLDFSSRLRRPAAPANRPPPPQQQQSHRNDDLMMMAKAQKGLPNSASYCAAAFREHRVESDFSRTSDAREEYQIYCRYDTH